MNIERERPITHDVTLTCILAAAVWCLHYATNFQGLWAPDAMEYADVARNIAEGKGITTNSIWTFCLATYQKLPFPSLMRPPLYPLLTAAVFKVTGVTEFAAVLGCGAAYVATTIPLFILASRFFGRRAAWLASLIYIFHNQSLYFSISGLTESLTGFFLTLFLCLFFLTEGLRGAFWGGLALGLAQVTSDKAQLWFIVALVWLLVMDGPRRWWGRPLYLLAGFLIPVLPFMLYNYVNFGILFFNKAAVTVAMLPGPSEGAANPRSLHPISAWAFATKHPFLLLQKFWMYLDGFARMVLFGGIVSPYVMAFALLGLFMLRTSEKASRCYGFLLTTLLLNVIAVSFFCYVEARYLMGFAPAVIGFGAGWFVQSARQISTRPVIRYIGIGVLLFLTLEPVTTVRSLIGAGEFSDQYKKAGECAYIQEWLNRHGGPQTIVVTDVPWATAWYARRTSILLPARMEELAVLNADIFRVDVVLITAQLVTQFRAHLTQTTDAPYRTLLEKRPPRFALGAGKKLAVFELAESQLQPNQPAVLYVRRPSTPADIRDAFGKPQQIPRWVAPGDAKK